MVGVVKWFKARQHFGFIIADGQEYFVHDEDMDPWVRLEEGQVVEFTPRQGPKGLRAHNVRPIPHQEESVVKDHAQETQHQE